MLSTRNWAIATKYSLTCLNEKMFTRAVEKLVQVYRHNQKKKETVEICMAKIDE